MVYVLSSLVEGQNILPMASPQKFATPSHILYVDDIIIFSRGTKKGLDSLMIKCLKNCVCHGWRMQ